MLKMMLGNNFGNSQYFCDVYMKSYIREYFDNLIIFPSVEVTHLIPLYCKKFPIGALQSVMLVCHSHGVVTHVFVL